ncbi:MAG TPA: sigma-54 dependent transcriptional regulator [Pseudomonadota bacterium]|nr:sigma-54 dependent transcriptional regulator [Pseudomonadota bacterium]
MRSALITWTDRGGERPPGSRPHPAGTVDQGPVLRLLQQPELAARYHTVWLLTTAQAQAASRELLRALRAQVEKVEIRELSVTDPSDYSQLFAELGPLCREIRRSHRAPGWDLDVLLSAGTPQAQTLWVILVQAGLLPARMLQVIPPQFVPVPHPRAFREVRLDIDGFPEVRALRSEVHRLRAAVARTPGPALIGDSEPMADLRARIERIGRADVRVPVLILGESGTGKELVARALHAASAERDGPFLAENCSAFSEGVLHSELFGHEAGAFTGATGRHRGLFEQAHGGTLFLDEVGELPPKVQATLLRVLQEGVLRRVGGDAEVRVDVRILAATHRDLRAMVARGEFRQDLYYRLCGATLEVPPLRAHIADLQALIAAFLDEIRGPRGRRLELDSEALRLLLRYDWPGNVRELRAEVQRWAVFCEGRVRVADLAPEIRAARSQPSSRRSPGSPTASSAPPAGLSLATQRQHTEEAALRAALQAQQGNLLRTARSLDIDRNTLKRKLHKYGLYPGRSEPT